MSELSVKNKTPAIRFKGFSGEWVENELGELCDTFEYGLNAAAKEYDGKNKYIRITDINETSREFDFSDVTSPATDLSYADNYELEHGDVLFARTGASVGKTYIYKKKDGKVYFAGFLIRARVKKSISPYFIFQSTLTNCYKKFIQITSQRSGQPGVNAQEYSQYVLYTPIPKEQTQIGNFFQQLDRLIAQHQQKHDKLRCVKKALLEKMFPKQGETQPAIRFKGFSEAWEEVSLDKFGAATSGTSIESEFSGNGKYKVISIGSYSEKSEYTDQGIRAGLSEKTKIRILNKNDLTMILNDKTLAGNIIGRVLLINEDDSFIYNQRTQRIEPYLTKHEPQFLYQLLNAPLMRLKIIKSSQGNTQIYVNWSSIKKIIYFLPSKKEQTKIGTLFQQLDSLISQQQSQVTKLGNIKQAMLAKMFV